MEITPEMARAELARRGASSSQSNPSTSPQTPNASDGITPEQARAELARREEIKQDYPGRRTLSNWVLRPLIEGGAMTAGGAAGTILSGGNPLGGVALGAAMYPPAVQAANAVDTALGIGGRPIPPGTIPEQIGRAGEEFKTGIGIEAGGKALGAAIPAIAKKAVELGVPTFLGPSKAATVARMENPEAITNAPSYLQQAERLPKSVGNVGKVIDKLDEIANRHLRTSTDQAEGAIPVSRVMNILSGLRDKLKIGESTVGAADKSASSSLDSLANDVDNIIAKSKMPDIVGPTGKPINLAPPERYISEADLKAIIQRVRKNVNFADKGASVTNSALTDTSGQLDALLKTQNPAYKKAMAPVAKLTKLHSDLLDKFGLTRRTGEGIQPSDATISSMKTLPAERRGVSQDVMKRLKAVTGEDYVQSSKNRQLADQFVGSNAQGSRRTLGGSVIGGTVGAALGSALGHPTAGGTIGSQIGAIAGMASDTAGREVGGNLIDAYVKAKPYLAKLPYEVIVRLISTGALGNPESKDGKK